ncbi:MAG: DNA double-strand break repair nuclease NurA [Armatimonadota bacterium]
MSTGGAQVFGDLPAALVEEALQLAADIGQQILDELELTTKQREAWREGMENAGVIRHEADLPNVQVPTTCGVDGSYAVERLLGIDLVGVAAVAVEGLTPPSERRHWDQPHHKVLVQREVHDAQTGTLLRALMMGYELELATAAPHQVVFVDGSLTTPLIHLNQALNALAACGHLGVAAKLREVVPAFLANYHSVLAGARSDRTPVAVPKYTARREIGASLGWPPEYDDKAMLTLLLRPGEFSEPMPLQETDQPWHLNTAALGGIQPGLMNAAKSVLTLLDEVFVLYYRPNRWQPAVRLEVPRAVAQTPGRLANVVSATKHQSGAAAIMEPYPLYMADRMVKHLSTVLPTFRHVATQTVAERFSGDVDEVYLSMHGYRTEAGGD